MNRQPFDWSNFTPVDTVNGGYIISKSAYANMRFNLPVVSTYQVGAHDVANLPGIAYNLWQDVSMWRVLLAFNGLQDAIQDVTAGIVLNVPDKTQVLAYLSANATNNTSSTPTSMTI